MVAKLAIKMYATAKKLCFSWRSWVQVRARGFNTNMMILTTNPVSRYSKRTLLKKKSRISVPIRSLI
ncbi:hypothetical protein HanIR_Chr06g0277841 [Helianthus annuus]|nr:hypothetical protein HanIR_Chr06g0277841 [Helianthus annuus]